MEVATAISYAGGKTESSRQRERVLVIGGYYGCKPAEGLQLPQNYNDRGVWTLLTQPLTRDFNTTFLVNFNNRIVAVRG